MENKEQINIRNAHCAYYEGQTGLCKAKEFVRCNPVNCKLYTIDELSTILELQQKLQAKEQECDKLKSENFTFEELIKDQEEQLDDDNVIIERFLIASGKSKDITAPDEFEEVFQDIEQTYSENEELNKECEELKKEKAEIKKYLGISSKTIMQRLEELQGFRDEAREREYRYKDALDEIEKIIDKMANTSILTFPDFSNEENFKMVMKQCNSGYAEILNIINKAKEE